MAKTIYKNLKYFLILTLCFPLIFVFSACGENASFDGTWFVVSTTQGETTKDRDTLTSELLDNSKQLNEQFNLKVSKDYSFALLTPASATAQTGTWRKENNANEETYKLTTLDNNVFTVTYESKNKIKVQIDETTYYIMKKK